MKNLVTISTIFSVSEAIKLNDFLFTKSNFIGYKLHFDLYECNCYCNSYDGIRYF